MGNVFVKFRLNLSSRSGEEDLKNSKQDGCQTKSLMTSQKKFSTVNCCVDEAQEISDFSHAAFYLTNFHRDTASPMTSRKITHLSHGEFIKMYEAKYFSIARFQRYRGLKFIVFFQDGAHTT